MSDYRVDILVRLVPMDPELPIEELATCYSDSTTNSRVWTRIEVAEKSRKMVERLLDKVFGEEPI